MRYVPLLVSVVIVSAFHVAQATYASSTTAYQEKGYNGVSLHPANEDIHAVRTERERLILLQHLAQMHTLREVAAANDGHFQMEYNFNTDSKASDLNMLGRGSESVVIGRLTKPRVQLSPNGKMIYTYYEVAIDDTLKGTRRASTVVVKLPGGSLTFDDGSVAEVVTPNFQVTLGNRYVLFLKPAPTGIGTDPADARQDVHVLTLGSQGIFDISTGQAISMASTSDPVRVQHQGVSAAVFVERARAAVVDGLGR